MALNRYPESVQQACICTLYRLYSSSFLYFSVSFGFIPSLPIKLFLPSPSALADCGGHTRQISLYLRGVETDSKDIMCAVSEWKENCQTGKHVAAPTTAYNIGPLFSFICFDIDICSFFLPFRYSNNSFTKAALSAMPLVFSSHSLCGFFIQPFIFLVDKRLL